MLMKPTRFLTGIKAKLWLLSVASNLVLAAQGALYTFGGNDLARAIPDNYPSGVAYAFNVTDTGQTITDVSVSFDISGGWNGDLYAYLSHDSDTLVLLDRVGVSATNTYGYGDAGFVITLSDSGSVNIHNYGGNGGSQLSSGTYLADGQTTSPFASPASFSATGGSATFANTFGTTDPNGSWTLFFADVSGGSIATLNDWSVNIEAVPEPAHVALAMFGFLFFGFNLLRFLQKRQAK